MGQNHLQTHSKFQKFQLSNLVDLFKLSGLFKRTTVKNKNNIFMENNKHLNETIPVKYCGMDIYKYSNHFLMGTESSLSRNGIIKIQKQPLEVFCRKRCCQKFCKIHRKRPMPETFLIKLQTSPQACNFIEKEPLAH